MYFKHVGHAGGNSTGHFALGGGLAPGVLRSHEDRRALGQIRV